MASGDRQFGIIIGCVVAVAAGVGYAISNVSQAEPGASGRVERGSLGYFGLTGVDLYAGQLSFVFGYAFLTRQAGVYSLARYGSQPKPLLRRALKLASHELGHTLGAKHCVFYECVLNGVNSLSEMDRKPLHLCPTCLRKLHWNLRFDAVRRYRRLAAFYRRVGLAEEARFAAARAADLTPKKAAAAAGGGVKGG